MTSLSFPLLPTERMLTLTRLNEQKTIAAYLNFLNAVSQLRQLKQPSKW